MSPKVLGRGGLFVLSAAIIVASFQNCAPSTLSAIVESDISTQTGRINFPGTTDYNITSESGESAIQIRNNSVDLDNCSSASSVLSLQIQGMSASALGCTEAYIEGRDNSFRCTDSSFQALFSQDGWAYNSQNSAWTFIDKLQGHPILAPGTYISYFLNDNQVYKIVFEIKNSKAASSCQVSAAAEATEPPASAPAPSTGGSSTGVNYIDGIHMIGGARVRVQALTGKSSGQKFNSAESGYSMIALKFTAQANAMYLFSSVRYDGAGANRVHTISEVPGGEAISSDYRCGAQARLQRDVSLRATTIPDQATYCQLQVGKIYYLNVRSPQMNCSEVGRGQISNSPCGVSFKYSVSIAN